MGKFSGILGAHISGKVGEVVYYTIHGKNCVRSLPKKSEVPPSEKQVLQRQRFQAMNNLSNQFKYVIIPQIWAPAAQRMTGRNLFIKTNKQAFDLQGKVTDWKLVKISQGKLFLPSEIRAQRQQAGSSVVNVSWIENYYKGGVPYWDELLAVSAGDGNFSPLKNTGIKRGELKGSFELPQAKTAATHVYLFFASLDRTKYSESICFELDA